MKTSFTRHAWHRVLGRLSLDPGEVADILDWDLAINIGTQGGRVHRLFFSAPDGMCFVAIQDLKRGEVVTVLPIDYHETVAWRVSTDAQEAAKSLVVPAARTKPSTVTEGPSAFRLSAYVFKPSGGIRSVSLGSWPASPYNGHIERLLEDDEFFREVGDRLASRGIPEPAIDSLHVRLGGKGTPVQFSLERNDAGAD